jgi:hypothetical protein
MSDPKIARDAAELEIDIWCETLEYKPSAEDREKLLTAYMAGRVSFDPAKENFSYRLRVPVELENHTLLSEVKVTDVTAQQFANAYNSIKVDTKGERTASVPMESILRQASDATGLALGVVQRILSRDFSVIQLLMGFFG